MLFQDYGGHTAAAAAAAAGDQTELNIFLSVIIIIVIIITDVTCDYIRIHIGKRFTISVDIAAHITTNTANIVGIINADIVTINTDIPDVIDVVTVTDKAVDSIGIGTDITTINITISTNMFVGMIMRVTAMAMIMTDNEVSIAVNIVDNATIVTVVVTVIVQCSILDDDSLI